MIPVFGMPVLLGLSAVLAATKAAPPGIGIIALMWGFAQSIWIGGSTRMRRRQRPDVDAERMVITGRSWTGRRTLNLAELRRVQRVKYTIRGRYGGTVRVDYVILVDAAGVHLSVPTSGTGGLIRRVLAYQQEHGRPQARVSRYAAMGLDLAPGDLRFSVLRGLGVFVATAAYTALICVLIVDTIPALAGYHGG
jgi:hypothetical protein